MKQGKKKSGNDITVAKLAIITAILTLLNNLIALLIRLIELLSN